MPPPAAPDAPPDDTANAAANDDDAGPGSRRSLRARPQHVSYRDDELAWEALFNQDESDDGGGGGGGGGDERGERPKGRGRGRPPKNQGEQRAGPVETVLGPSGRQVRPWKVGGDQRGASEGNSIVPPAAVEVRGVFSVGLSLLDAANLLPFEPARPACRLSSDLAVLSIQREQVLALEGRGVERSSAADARERS